jgi:hypothetical protein
MTLQIPARVIEGAAGITNSRTPAAAFTARAVVTNDPDSPRLAVE